MTTCNKCGGKLTRRRDGLQCVGCGKVFFGAFLEENNPWSDSGPNRDKDLAADADREMGIEDNPEDWGDDPFGGR